MRRITGCQLLHGLERERRSDRFFYGFQNKSTHCAFIAEANFPLGRMHVNIDLSWVDLKKEKGGRVAPFLDPSIVGIEYGKAKCPVVYRPVIDQSN